MLCQLDSSRRFKWHQVKDSQSCWLRILYSLSSAFSSVSVSTRASSAPLPACHSSRRTPYPRIPRHRPATPYISLQLHYSWTFLLVTKHGSPHVSRYSRTCPYNVVLNALIAVFSFANPSCGLARPARTHRQAHRAAYPIVIRGCMMTIDNRLATVGVEAVCKACAVWG